MVSLEKVALIGTRKKKGPILSKSVYEKLVDFILKSLTSDPSGAMTLDDLFDKANRDISFRTIKDLPWHLLQVKIDLRERGIITTFFAEPLKQLIKIHPLHITRIERQNSAERVPEFKLRRSASW